MAHATTFTAEGDWDGNGGGVVCSNSGATGALCQASIPHNYLTLDGVVYDAGAVDFFASETLGFGSYPNNFYPVNKPAIAITGLISEGAGGVGPHPAPLQPGATISGSLDIPSYWGDVGVYGYVTEETNQYNNNPGGTSQADMRLTGGNQSVDAQRFYPGTLSHTAGDPFSISWSKRITCCGVTDSADIYQFEVVFVNEDPAAVTPEPGTFGMLFGSLVVGVLAAGWRRSSRDSLRRLVDA